MRVVVLSDLVRPNGAGVMALLAADILTGAGHDVVVLGGAMQLDLEVRLAEQHAAAVAFTNDEKALDGSVTPTDHVAFVHNVQRWFHEQLAIHQPDIVYVHNCGRIMSQLDLADLSTKVPVVHTMHDEWFYTDSHYTFRSSGESPVVRTFEPGRSDSVLEHRYDELFEIPDRVGNFTAVGPSQWITERAARVFPTLDVVHLRNAVDTTLFDLQDCTQARELLGLPPDRAIALFVGSPTQERKGFQKFEHAMRSAVGPDGRSPLRLIAGGTGSITVGSPEDLFSEGPIADLVSQRSLSPIGALGIAGDALVLSGLDRSLMPALFGAADVLVHPSVIDNLPTVPIEAGLCGTFTLASDVGGTRETIAETAGLFDQRISASDLGERISVALADAANESTEQRQARRDTQLSRFTIDTHRDGLLRLLESVAGRGIS